MLVRLLAAAMIAAAVPQLVLAQPAVVRVFEAKARNAPAADAPVVHVFPENAPVSVSETAEQGFRRIRLPDGATAWVEESALAFPEAAATPAATPPAASVPVPPPSAPETVTKADLRVPIYVKDLNHLADLVKDDPVVGPDARRLAARRHGALAAGVVGLGVSVLLMGVGFKQMDDEFDRSFDSPEFGDHPGDDGQGMIFAGLGLSLVTGIAVWAIHPKRNDLLDVINGWNGRHPGEPFEIESREVGHRGRHHH